MDLKIFLFEVLPILFDFLGKKRYVEVVNTIFTKNSVNFNVEYEYSDFEGKHLIKGIYFKDILRFLYLNRNKKDYKKLLNANKFSFKKLLAYGEDYYRVTSYDKNFKDLLLFLTNCGFFIKNPYKFNTLNTFTKIKSYDLYHSNKGLHLIYSFNIFDYRLDTNKSDSKNITVLYLPIGLYKSFLKWNKQDNTIITMDKYNFYPNYKDNNQITHYNTKKDFDIESFYYYCKKYDNINMLDHEKLSYEEEYYLKLAYSFKQGEYDLVLENKPIKACYDACKPSISLGLSNEAHNLLLKSQLKKELKESTKYSKNFKKSLLLIFDDLYNKGLIQDMDL